MEIKENYLINVTVFFWIVVKAVAVVVEEEREQQKLLPNWMLLLNLM
jgi:hypothetical protein